jgi:preprotein translocase subunit YajC
VLLLIVLYLLFALPARRRQRAHAAMQDDVIEGDEIITAGGLHAIVREAAGKELRVEIAPGIVVTLDRRAVAAVAQEIEVAADGQPEESLEIGPQADVDDQGAR